MVADDTLNESGRFLRDGFVITNVGAGYGREDLTLIEYPIAATPNLYRTIVGKFSVGPSDSVMLLSDAITPEEPRSLVGWSLP